jgi:hypothetical protein
MREPMSEATVQPMHHRLTVDSIYLVGFPKAQSEAELSGGVEPNRWVYLVPHLVPESRVFDFVLFGDNVVANGALPAAHPSDLSTNDAKLEESNQSSEPSKEPEKQDHAERRTCCAEGLEKEAYLLLDAAKEDNPTNREVYGIVLWLAKGVALTLASPNGKRSYLLGTALADWL